MLLSIIIPSYNHARFVLSTIRAAARIAIQDKEIIVIDDGSGDASVGVIRDHINQSRSTNIRLIARENRGLVKTLNEALSIAQGEYLYAVASDDIPIPEGVTHLIKILENNPKMQFIMGNALVMHSEEQKEFRPTYGAGHRRFFAMPSVVRNKEIFLNYPIPMLLQATVFRVSALRAGGGWREDIIMDDVPLFISLFSRCSDVEEHFGYRPEIMTCLYRWHQTNTSKNVASQFAIVEQMLTMLCPPEWRNAAIARMAAYYSLVALRRRRVQEAAHYLHTMIVCVGLVRSGIKVIVELRKVLMIQLSRKYGCDRSIVVYARSASEKG